MSANLVGPLPRDLARAPRSELRQLIGVAQALGYRIEWAEEALLRSWRAAGLA